MIFRFSQLETSIYFVFFSMAMLVITRCFIIPILYPIDFYHSYPINIPYIWVNYNISLTWILRPIWAWFPLLTMIPVRENSEVVIIYPDILKKQQQWPHDFTDGSSIHHIIHPYQQEKYLHSPWFACLLLRKSKNEDLHKSNQHIIGRGRSRPPAISHCPPSPERTCRFCGFCGSHEDIMWHCGSHI